MAKKPAKKAAKKAAKPAKKAAKKPAKKASKKSAQPAAMPKAVHGTFIWNELMTRDDERTMEFFNKVVGWTHEDMPMGPGEPPYRVMKIKGAERGVAGIMKMTEPKFPAQVPIHWCGYIAVDDVDKRAELVKQNGGEIVHGPEDIPNIGRFCIIKEPTGTVLAFMTPEGGTA
jgi:predicted enzyme related to lactoylglutathione lyase